MCNLENGMIRLDAKICIDRERDSALRADEYRVISNDREGNEVEFISFYVSDSGKIHFIKGPCKLPL